MYKFFLYLVMMLKKCFRVGRIRKINVDNQKKECDKHVQNCLIPQVVN